MSPVDFDGPPAPLQFLLFLIAALFDWGYGYYWQRLTQAYYPAIETHTPRWICWLCGQFDANYGMNPFAALRQVPQVCMLPIVICMYQYLPTAGLFGGFLIASLIVYTLISRSFERQWR